MEHTTQGGSSAVAGEEGENARGSFRAPPAGERHMQALQEVVPLVEVG